MGQTELQGVAVGKCELVPVEGGREPELGELFTNSMNDMMENIGPYVLAGLVHTAIMIPVVVALVLGIYLVMIVLGFGGVMGGALLTVMAGEMLGEGAAVFTALVVQIAVVLGFFVVIGAISAAIAGLLAPLGASMTRAVAMHQRGEGGLGPSAAFEHAGENLFSVVALAIIMGFLTGVGLMFCYIPGLLVPVVFGFAHPLVALHGMGPIEALRESFRQFMSKASWHIPYVAVSIALGMVAYNIPILGSMFLVSVHVRAYRELYGDGPEPMLG